MSELRDKVNKSIERLKAFEPEDGYYLAFSGGKDSVVCKALLQMAGCKFDATYRVTTVDPPELVRFIKDKHPDVKREVPRYPDEYKNENLAGKPISMWNLIPEKMMPPTRTRRYCCEYLKESGGDGRMTVTGVRWEESQNRKNNQGIVTMMDATGTKAELHEGIVRNRHGNLILVNDNDEARRLVETCYKRNKTTVNPIIDWTEIEVWEFIRGEEIPYCELYDEGLTRLGCIGCPLLGTRKREREFVRWPKYKWHYMKAFERMLQVRSERGKLGADWRIGYRPQDVFNWWMDSGILPGQINMFEEEEEEEE